MSAACIIKQFSFQSFHVLSIPLLLVCVVDINDTYFCVNPVITSCYYMQVVSIYLELKEIMLMVFCIIAPPK